MIRAWAIGGVLAVLLEAVVRLALIARDSLAFSWEPLHWVALAVWTAAMLWGEGYRTFQRYVAPRVAARARRLSREPFGIATVFAPLYALSFFHDETRAMCIAWGVTAFIVAFAWSMHLLPHPWRGIIDFGVVAALSWGVVAIVREAART